MLRWILSVLLLFVGIMGLLRLFFYWQYNPAGKPYSGSTLLMGMRFDIKFASIMAVSMLVLCALPFLNPIKKPKAAPFWNVILTIVFFLVLLVYAIDFYHYSYVQQRLNAAILSYFNDAAITFNMGLQSYPVFRVLLLIILFTIVFAFVFRRLLFNYQTQTVINHRKGIGWYILFFLLFALGIFGKLGQFNLRWSDAFTLSDNFKANVALNPFQSFFSTLRYRDTRPDVNKVRSYYSMMADYLQVTHKDSATLNFTREYHYSGSNTKPNVVLVICESFCMFRSTMSGNPLNTTPYFNELCNKGVFFNRCFTPAFPTARGVWATITSIPDVVGDNNRTASRNPEVVNQRTIMNAIPGYGKYYFIGGDPTWANIKGMLLNNIDSLHLYSQDDFKAAKVDVWGIDDKNLLLETNKILATQQEPFFAVIQTADNHAPYTIPEKELASFKKINYPKDTLEKYGFESNDQFNAFRYTDYCFEHFMEAAKKEEYFDNTIFVFVGDHGVPGNVGSLYPQSFSELSLTRVHVPLLFYAPALLQPKLVQHVCSQVDIMPSIATLIKTSFENTTMGQSLFDSSYTYRENAFTIDHELHTIGMANNDYYYRKNVVTGKVDFAPIRKDILLQPGNVSDSIRNSLERLADAYYHTAKYVLFNNGKK